ncbi:hypothetical protein SD70_09565 [Gordoniibacillus kamchatkensis]|uniref:Uncharacterized protein n=1 Tax=Gordoniibacillus kamchatkensis TaxID=1590651 RepID=A0ABR5AJ32_9BACL|nr:hypothetical protein [Paenibacillus sp. VKM B-2647]KIL41051.1 hypothetical protein SD70_09565 [Paenibacillus sp. VKM B-2647]
MRRSAKQHVLTNLDTQLLQPSYTEAIALASPVLGDAELGAAYTSVSEQLKQTPNKSFRP